MCKVKWCRKKPLKYINGNYKIYCGVHGQYKKYALSAPTRPWLMYKVEKVVNNDLICEHCGLDMIKHYKNASLKAILTAMDVDHIDSKIKGTTKGEHPNNYQLLCKMCHVIKSYEDGDYVNKRYKKSLDQTNSIRILNKNKKMSKTSAKQRVEQLKEWLNWISFKKSPIRKK